MQQAQGEAEYASARERAHEIQRVLEEARAARQQAGQTRWVSDRASAAHATAAPATAPASAAAPTSAPPPPPENQLLCAAATQEPLGRDEDGGSALQAQDGTCAALPALACARPLAADATAVPCTRAG